MQKVKNAANAATTETAQPTNGQANDPLTEQAAPATETEKLAEPEITLEGLQLAAKEAKQAFKLNEDETKDDVLQLAWLKARKAVTEFENKQKAIEAQKLIDEKRKVEFDRVETLIVLYDAAKFANEEFKRGNQTIEQANAANDQYKAHKTFIQEELAKHVIGGKQVVVRNTLNIPAGMTGEQLSKGQKGSEIVELFKANRLAGMNDTENVKAIIEAGHSRGTTGAVVLAYRREIGEAPAKG